MKSLAEAYAAEVEDARRRGFLVTTRRHLDLNKAYRDRCWQDKAPCVLVFRARVWSDVDVDLVPCGRTFSPKAFAAFKELVRGHGGVGWNVVGGPFMVLVTRIPSDRADSAALGALKVVEEHAKAPEVTQGAAGTT